jgi:APA family basic amino acid/polyamine antiporter
LIGMISSLMIFQYGQARVWFAMSRDRLLPSIFSRVHGKNETPYVSTWVAGLVVGVGAGIFDIGTLGDLTNIGTLFAFVVVSLGVIVLRRTHPDHHRTFRVPMVPVLPVLSILCCGVLMLSLPWETWVRFVVWLAIGLGIYFGYSRKRVTAA